MSFEWRGDIPHVIEKLDVVNKPSNVTYSPLPIAMAREV
jgi:hypothetical protein